MSRLTRRLSFPWLDYRHRLRDRLVVAMLLVALVPLATYAVLVAADLGSISRQTVTQTDRSLVAAQEDRQQSELADRATLVDLRLTSLAQATQRLSTQMAGNLARPARPV